MENDICEYINNCIFCMDSKPRNEAIQKEEKHITTNVPLQLSVDLIGKLPRSRTYGYILSSVDIHKIVYAL